MTVIETASNKSRMLNAFVYCRIAHFFLMRMPSRVDLSNSFGNCVGVTPSLACGTALITASTIDLTPLIMSTIPPGFVIRSISEGVSSLRGVFFEITWSTNWLRCRLGLSVRVRCQHHHNRSRCRHYWRQSWTPPDRMHRTQMSSWTRFEYLRHPDQVC